MTAAVAAHFLDGEGQNKSSKVLSFGGEPQVDPLPFSSAMVPLLDRKVGGASAMGLYQRRHSVSTPVSKFSHSQLSCSLRMDPLALPIGGNNKENRFRERSYSENGERLKLSCIAAGQVNSSRYKTELCRPFEESGSCKYGDKCQFAHGQHELRSLSRHPKYKTELCRTFHTIGFCPYGPRCHFIHNAEERRGPPPPPLSSFNKLERPRLQHSCSFAGFPSSAGFPLSPTSHTPPPLTSNEDLTEWPRNPFTVSSEDFGGLFGPGLARPLALELPPPSPTIPSFFRPSESPPSTVDSLSDHEGYQSSLGSLSGSESPVLDSTRRLPIFSRLSISDD
ncbi:mRNA decay activator protein ZFP36L1b [Pygocentrus nattereri]|uniref:mRNA decay activator protein ZFP36 n=1 Tax=Pygocentrus nattereri TaxID=42514 RepID=A0A3B4DJ19_PYGNA|nr:mRNA decay activator protein ZFP36L1b [Pygocentrus nattereri]